MHVADLAESFGVSEMTVRRDLGALARDGKVERVQRTALEEFWPIVDPKAPNLLVQLEAWRTFYNHDRPHSSLSGSTPAERIAELATKIPAPEAIQAAYDPSREFIRSQNTRYRWLPTNARVT